jgi:hypothetical protein
MAATGSPGAEGTVLLAPLGLRVHRLAELPVVESVEHAFD